MIIKASASRRYAKTELVWCNVARHEFMRRRFFQLYSPTTVHARQIRHTHTTNTRTQDNAWYAVCGAVQLQAGGERLGSTGQAGRAVKLPEKMCVMCFHSWCDPSPNFLSWLGANIAKPKAGILVCFTTGGYLPALFANNTNTILEAHHLLTPSTLSMDECIRMRCLMAFDLSVFCFGSLRTFGFATVA